MSQQIDPKDVEGFKKDKLQYMYGIRRIRIAEINNKLIVDFYREDDEQYGWIKSRGYITVPTREKGNIASKMASLFSADFVFWFINTYGCPSEWHNE